MVLGEIIGPDLLVILLIFVLLFGSSQLPKLARSLGQASKEFHQGFMDGVDADDRPGHSAGQAGAEAPSQPGGPVS